MCGPPMQLWKPVAQARFMGLRLFPSLYANQAISPGLWD